MKREKYIAPEFEKGDFHCPTCNVYASQSWHNLFHGFNARTNIPELRVAFCNYCGKFSLWINGELVHPSKITAPLAHQDMPESVLEFYNEARAVSATSQRAAAALLRIAAKKLCESLEEDEPNLNRAIGNLSKKGLPQHIIKSLDTVRIVGNEGGAHEGQIDLSGEDNGTIVNTLFWLINFIVEKTITEPKEVAGAFSSLPEDKKMAAEKRDEEK